MLFSSKPKILIYLRRDGVQFLGKSPASVVFPAELVQNLEVASQDELYKLMGQYAKQIGVANKKALMLLDNSVIFQKALPAAGGPATKAVADDFATKVPFESVNIATISLQAKGQHVLIATNRSLFVPIAKAFIDQGCKITAIAPSAIYGPVAGEIDQDWAQQVLAKSRLAERANFLQK